MQQIHKEAKTVKVVGKDGVVKVRTVYTFADGRKVSTNKGRKSDIKAANTYKKHHKSNH